MKGGKNTQGKRANGVSVDVKLIGNQASFRCFEGIWEDPSPPPKKKELKLASVANTNETVLEKKII